MVKRHQHECPVAQMLNIFGDHWTMLIMREAFYGATRFSEFERNIGIAKNLLTQRLESLCAEGVLERRDVGANGSRNAYHLTQKGRALQPVLVAMTQWGNRFCYSDETAPILVVEKSTGQPIDRLQFASVDGRILAPRDLTVVPGPGASDKTRRRLAAAKRPS